MGARLDDPGQTQGREAWIVCLKEWLSALVLSH